MVQALPLVLLSKVVHIMFIWFLLFIAEKCAIDAFIQGVYIESKDPPRLGKFVSWAFAFDILFCLVFTVFVYMCIARFITEPLIGGQSILIAIAFDMYVSLTLSMMASLVVAKVTQNRSCLRYKDDGLRGIRAFFLLALCISVVLCLPPYYLLLA